MGCIFLLMCFNDNGGWDSTFIDLAVRVMEKCGDVWKTCMNSECVKGN